MVHLVKVPVDQAAAVQVGHQADHGTLVLAVGGVVVAAVAVPTVEQVDQQVLEVGLLCLPRDSPLFLVCVAARGPQIECGHLGAGESWGMHWRSEGEVLAGVVSEVVHSVAVPAVVEDQMVDLEAFLAPVGPAVKENGWVAPLTLEICVVQLVGQVLMRQVLLVVVGQPPYQEEEYQPRRHSTVIQPSLHPYSLQHLVNPVPSRFSLLLRFHLALVRSGTKQANLSMPSFD